MTTHAPRKNGLKGLTGKSESNAKAYDGNYINKKDKGGGVWDVLNTYTF